MKTQTVFKNTSLVSVMNGSIVVKDSTGKEHTFTNASIVSVSNGTIIIEKEWKPKRGELVKVTNSCIDAYCIINNINNDYIFVFGWKKIDSNIYYLKNHTWMKHSTTIISPVTPEEQKEFDDFCKSQGKLWNKETLQWEKYRWIPKDGDTYYHVDLELPDGVGRHSYKDDSIDRRNREHCNCFQTEKQAKEASEKVKELLKSL